MKILVTGGCGFIGTNLVRLLSQSGHDVAVYDNLSRGRREWLDDCDVEIVQGDILDIARLEKALAGIEAVVHLAAYGSVIESITDPGPNFDNNVVGTFNVFSASSRAGVGKVVFASTGGALIGNAEPPVSEESLPRPISPYGASKLCGEAYCHAFGHAYDIDMVALRFANVFGPQSAHKKGAVTAFSKAVMLGEPMIIFGDGSASRDFLYVDDLCHGIQLALEARLPGCSVFHLASGEETRVIDLARGIARVAGKPDHPIEHREKRRGEVDRNFATYDRIREALGFEPSYSFEQGLAATWQWFQDNREATLTAITSDS